jgi:hypothetical protein
MSDWKYYLNDVEVDEATYRQSVEEHKKWAEEELNRVEKEMKEMLRKETKRSSKVVSKGKSK